MQGLIAKTKPLLFDRVIFQKLLNNMGVSVSLGSSDFDNGEYRIMPVVEASVDLRFNTIESTNYTRNSNDVTEIHTVVETSLATYKQQRIAEVYRKAAFLLNQSTEGRSSVEIAAWPLLKADIVQYNIDASVGSAMTEAIATSSYDAAALVAYLTPKIAQESAILLNRKTHTEAILLLETHINVADYDTETGWPA